MRIFDSHCHLDDAAFADELPAVIERARRAGVTAMLSAGVDLQSSRRAVALARAHRGVWASVGVHPHDVRHANEDTLGALRALAAAAEVRAWGEIGLDFNRLYSPRADQERWLVRQLEVADELGLPVIFHERDSGGRLLEILAAHPNPRRRAVVHCFSGTAAELEAYLAMGFHIGVTGIVTMPERGRRLRRLLAAVPAERLLVETDAPYLTPHPENRRRRRNEPALVADVLACLAELRGEAPERLAARLWRNTCRLFGLPED